MCMSDATLMRVGSAYRNGYRDGEAGRPNRYAGPADPLVRPFGHYDYHQGYEAGANDAHWEAVFAGRATDVKTRRCGLSDGSTFSLRDEAARQGLSFA
jgi:hypothetical protein